MTALQFSSPCQSISCRFPEVMSMDSFPLLVQYFVLLLLLEILVITEIQQHLFQLCPHVFLEMASIKMGVMKTFVWLAFAVSYVNKGDM